MGQQVHKRETPDGTRYRVWSTVSGGYSTPPMTEDQVLRWLLEARLEHAITDMYSLRRRVEHAEDFTDEGAWETVRDDWTESEKTTVKADPESYIAGKVNLLAGEFPWYEDQAKRLEHVLICDGKAYRVIVTIKPELAV
jgi:hypothetical protein